MDSANARPRLSARAVFEDGFGKRYHAVAPGGDPIDLLVLRHELASHPSFEPLLRESVSAASSVQSPHFQRIRVVLRLRQDTSNLGVASDRVDGVRLLDLLTVAERRLLPLDLDASLCLIAQLVTAVSVLHENPRRLTHGAIAPERMIITPDGRLVLLDYVFAAALEQLELSAERCWKELNVALPDAAGAPRFDQRADIVQAGLVALALLLRRPMRADEYPVKIGVLADCASSLVVARDAEPALSAVCTWLRRMLQLDADGSMTSAFEARTEFNRMLGADHADKLDSVRSLLAGFAPFLSAPEDSAEPMPPALAATSPKAVAEAAEPLPRPYRVDPPFVATADLSEMSAVRVAETTEPADPFTMPEQTIFDEEAGADMTHGTSRWRWIAAALVLVTLAGGGAIAGRRYFVPPASAAMSGTLVVNTNPPGTPVLVDNEARGTTPLTVTLEPGEHVVELLTGGEPRLIPVTIAAGSTVSQFIEVPRTSSAKGQLHVRTEPSGVRVSVDGQPRGVSPIIVDGLAPGSHAVLLTANGESITHDVTVEGGLTASLVVPMAGAPSGPASGWISVAAPADVQVFEDARLLGSSRVDRIMVPAGQHALDIVSEALGFSASQTVNVSPGQVARVTLDWPDGSMAINAQPWAEVWVDGDRVGETPIGSIAVPIGPHEVVFRHPELGEQVVRTTVTLQGPTRVSVDLRKR